MHKPDKTQDEYAMKFHNWCNKLTVAKNPNCYVKVESFATMPIYQIKPTGALLNIFKKQLK